MRKRLSLIICCLLLFGLRAVSAQGTSGKIQGTVTDPAGAAVAKAQVIIAGTAFGAVTDDKGYYFINNVPPGTYTLRAQFIGFAPTDLTGVHVLGGQTLTENFPMKPSAVVVGGINVVAAANPIVPRDEVTSKSIVSGQTIASLPISDVRSVLSLQPGVVESGNGNGVSIRGGRPGEANVYIDGAPVRTGASAGMSSALTVQVQTNAVEEASVTTGALPVQFGDAQSGVIQFTTRAGGERLQGSLSAQTDGLISSASSGLNRFEGTLGGPVPGIQGLRFYLSGVLSGQTECSTNLNQTCAGLSAGAGGVANYAVSGVDTTVSFAGANGVQNVAIPRFVQYGGQCDASQNAGFDCHGSFRPMDWGTSLNLQGKVSYSYGSGSSVAFSTLAGGFQNRNWPGTDIGDPSRYSGAHTWQRTYTLNWTHQLFKSSDRALAFNVVASYGTNNQISGPLDPTSELNTRNPLGGVELSTLNFSGFGSFANEFFTDPDQIVKNLRTNSGLRIPLAGRTDLNSVQPYRENPYAMASGNWYTAGLSGNNGGTLYSEKRLYGTANVDWQANRYHRFTFGGEIKQNDVAAWQGGFVNQIFMNAYHDKPINGAAWAADRLDLGDVVIDLGMRWDYFNSKALFANTPGFIFNNPSWDHSLNSNSSDAAYQAALAKVMTPGVAHTTISPRIGVSFPITDQTDFHLSYSHQVQSPDLATLLGGINTDLTNSNANDAFGRDVGFGKTILFEFGVRHAFNPDFVIDVA
ncbi:MAG TPA: carboxypeptidase regulatory-like domain-containing protein, partial [Gemmatimonadales bacterium]|nr:carboxypeptidase regulatory-like domain-containing protein [Gemmatimonadales bacterium]